VLLAGAAVLFVSQRPSEAPRDVDTGLDPGVRGPLAYQVEVVETPTAQDDEVDAKPAGASTTRGAPGLVPGERDASTPTAAEVAPPSPVDVAPVEAVNAAGDAAAPLPTPTPTVSVDELRARMSSMNNQIRERFLLPDDVPDYRKLTNDITKALAANSVDEAEAGVRQLESALSSLRITDAFIRKKLARVEANFPQGWPRNDVQRKELAKLRTDVAERFGANDLPGANYALNKLWLFSLKARQTNDAH
jgi:hypothetical protein